MLAFILCKTNTCICELSVAQLLRFLTVESAHPDLSPRFGMGCSYFPGYILGFNRRYSFWEPVVTLSPVLRVYRSVLCSQENRILAYASHFFIKPYMTCRWTQHGTFIPSRTRSNPWWNALCRGNQFYSALVLIWPAGRVLLGDKNDWYASSHAR